MLSALFSLFLDIEFVLYSNLKDADWRYAFFCKTTMITVPLIGYTVKVIEIVVRNSVYITRLTFQYYFHLKIVLTSAMISLL